MLPCKTVKPASKELIAQELSGWVFGEVNSEKCLRPIFFFIESFPQMRFEGKWLQNRLRADKNKSISLLAVDIQGHQRGGLGRY